MGLLRQRHQPLSSTMNNPLSLVLMSVRAVTGIRGDRVNPGLLGMKKIIYEDSLRRALSAIPETETEGVEMRLEGISSMEGDVPNPVENAKAGAAG